MPTEEVGTFFSVMGSPFFFRFIIPALIISWALVPLIPGPWTTLISVPSLGVQLPIPVFTLLNVPVYLVALLSVGFILRGLYPVHTGILMGILCPQRPRAWAIQRLERYTTIAQAAIAAPLGVATSSQWWNSVRARDFLEQLPHVLNAQTGTFEPVIRAPTLYGNIISALMTDVGRRENLLWQMWRGQAPQGNAPSRWLAHPINAMLAAEYALGREDRRELEQVAAAAEAPLSLSLGFTLLAPVYLWAMLWSWLKHLPGTGGHAIMVGACVSLAYIAYRNLRV